MSQDQLAKETKQLKQRQLQLGVILLALIAAMMFLVRGGHQFATTWGIAMIVGLLVELSSLRRMIRLLALLSILTSEGT